MGAADVLEALELDFPNTVKERQKLYGLKDAYKTISWVYACTNLIADCISGVEFELYRLSRKGEEVYLKKNDPAFICFYPPKKGEIYTLSEMIKMQFLHLGLFGESFGTLTKKGKRTITGVELFNPLLVSPEYSTDGSKIDYWKVRQINPSGSGKATERVIRPEDMIQWKYPNPYNPFRGLSPLTAARLAIEQDMNMATWNAGFFQNGIRNPIAMLLKQTFNSVQREQFMNQLRRNFTGFVKGQLPLLVEGGVDVKVLANTIKDLDFVEGKSLTREELCAVYNVPPAQVGIFRYANYANSREQRSILYQNNLRPKMMYYRDVFQQTILDPYFPGVLCDFEWDSVDAFREDPTIEKTNAETIRIRAEAAQILWNLGYDQKQISVAVGDPNFDPTKNTPDPGLDNIFDKEAAAAEEEAAREAAEDESSMEDDDEDMAEMEQPAKSFTFAKSKNGFKLYATSADLREHARLVNSKFIEPEVERLADFVRIYGSQVSKAGSVSKGFWKKNWAENVEPILDSAYAKGVKSVNLDLKSVTLDKVESDLESSPDFVELKARAFEISTDSNYAQHFITAAFNIGRLARMKQLGVFSHLWCCAGDDHKKLHGSKAELGSLFLGTTFRYPGDTDELKSCTCTIYPAEIVRMNTKIPIIKKA